MKLFSVPNIITLGNLFCGCLSVFSFFNLNLTNEEHIKFVFFLTIISLILDFFDGFIARLLNSNSEIGKQLDSLADLVSFGLVPTLIIYKVLKEILSYHSLNENSSQYLLFFPILITLFSALRLAKFNLDETQHNYFKGLATPANTILILSVALIYFLERNSLFYPFFDNLIVIIFIILTSSFLLICNIPMFSFKINLAKLKSNYYIFIFLIILIISILLLKFTGLFIGLLSYIIISIIFKNKITQN